MKTKKGFFLSEKMIRVLILLIIFVILFAAFFGTGGLLPGSKKLTDRIVDLAKTVKIGEQVPPAKYEIPAPTNAAFGLLSELLEKYKADPLRPYDCIVAIEAAPFKENFNKYFIDLRKTTTLGTSLIIFPPNAKQEIKSTEFDRLRLGCIANGQNILNTFPAKKVGTAPEPSTAPSPGTTTPGSFEPLCTCYDDLSVLGGDELFGGYSTSSDGESLVIGKEVRLLFKDKDRLCFFVTDAPGLFNKVEISAKTLKDMLDTQRIPLCGG